MAQSKALTVRQLEVLRWICDGCTAGEISGDDYAARISAGALRGRGLVETSGSGSTWSAKITKAGKDYIELADGPNAPAPRSSMSGSGSQQLVDDLVAAGGSLLFPRKGYHSPKDGSPDYERRAKIAQRKGLAPRGKKLVICAEEGEWRISLVDMAPGTPLDVAPVPLPGRVAR